MLGRSVLPSREFKSGFVAVVGRPNAGKSTLLNTLIGQKVAITSNMAQTTRHRLRAIYNSEHSQIVFVDTPGLHKPHDVLGQELNASTFLSFSDVDVLVMMIDASKAVGKGDQWVANHITSEKAAKICVISKTDLVTENEIAKQVEAAQNLCNWDALVCLSSVNKHNLNAFIEEVESFLPEGPAWFPNDIATDQQEEVVVAELIREKIIRSLHDEIPHSIGVEVDHIEHSKKLTSIYATIYVERDSQKGIVIGAKGANLKKIGQQTRQELEKIMEHKVFLDLSVKLKKHWRRDLNQIRRFGYGEGA